MKFEELELKSSELAMIKGGTSTTLIVQAARDLCAESEFYDTNGNGEHDEDDEYVGMMFLPCP